MRDDLRPQIAPNPPQYGRTSASLCCPPRHQFGMKITIGEWKHAALSRQTVKLNALTSSPHAPQPCHHGYAPLPNWRPTRTTSTHFPRCQFTHSSPPPRATANPIPQPTGTTTHTPQPALHNHQSIPPPARRTHPTTNTQSANPTTPLKPIRTGRFSPPDRIHPQTTGSQIATC